MPEIFLSVVDRGTCCISAPHIRLHLGNRSTSITESVSHPLQSIISSGLVTHFDFRPFAASIDSVAPRGVVESYAKQEPESLFSECGPL